jgi:hypothetical protein
MPFLVTPYLYAGWVENTLAVEVSDEHAAHLAGELYEWSVAEWALQSTPAGIKTATRHMKAMHRQMVQWGGGS